MQGNGFLIFIVSATVLWAIGKGLGPNIGPAWNVFTGATKSASNPSTPATSSGSLFQTAGIPQIPNYPIPVDPNAISYQPPAIPYLGPGVSIA